MEWRRVREIPKSRNIGMMSEKAVECMQELARMQTGEILHLPIGEFFKAADQRTMKNKYVGYIATARTKLSPRQFSIKTRGTDIFVQRTA